MIQINVRQQKLEFDKNSEGSIYFEAAETHRHRFCP